LNNIVRTTIQALGAVLGGTQSLHTNSFDEALGLPTDESALVALRTQQIIANESGVADTADPLAGSYFVESLTAALEEAAVGLLDQIAARGGAVAAIEEGWMQGQIEESAYVEAKRQSSGKSVVVGVNKFVTGGESTIPVLDIDPELERGQIARLDTHRHSRNKADVDAVLATVREVAATSDNLLPVMREALMAGSTIGEVSDVLRGVFGVHRPS
jgi:methylmalonyl-CoA mutase N-terminal domain/subunit